MGKCSNCRGINSLEKMPKNHRFRFLCSSCYINTNDYERALDKNIHLYDTGNELQIAASKIRLVHGKDFDCFKHPLVRMIILKLSIRADVHSSMTIGTTTTSLRIICEKASKMSQEELIKWELESVAKKRRK